MTEDKDYKPKKPVDFKVYDVPVEVKNDYISMAKLQYDNDVWKVMADAMAALKEDKFTRVQTLQERVAHLEEQVATLQKMLKHSDNTSEEDNLKPTLGDR